MIVEFIGIDVGGTKCLGVVTDAQGNVTRELRLATPHGSQLVDTLCDMVRQLLSQDVVAVGVGLPGLIQRDGVVRVLPHISAVENVNLVQLMHSQLGDAFGINDLRIEIDNDATTAALAEWKLGAARGAQNAVLVTLGTGIGGGLILGGQMCRGAHGFAGEFGHFVVEANGRPCVCGQRGCWEMYASGSALGAMWPTGNSHDVMAAHAAGDPQAVQVVAEFARWVAMGLATLVNVCDPECVVIGGGLVSAREQFLDAVSESLGTQVYGHLYRELPAVLPAQLGEKAGAIGSALMVALQ